jgi:DNA end-binding protein Ku
VYVLLRETLKAADKIGIAQIVMRTKQHLAALMPVDNVIVLNILRYHDEIRSLEGIALPDASSKRAAVSDKEVKMAMSLLEDMSEPWQPEAYHDTYRDDVMAMIDKKIAANETQTVSEEEPESVAQPTAKVIDLMDLLKKSLDNKSRTPAKNGKKNTSNEDDKPAAPRKQPAKKPAAKKTTAAKTATGRPRKAVGG